MADKSKIDWTDATWNPIVGCSIVSPACTNCYAMDMADRIQRMTPETHYAGTTKSAKTGPIWSSTMKQAPDFILTQPLQWTKPRKIFVNSMGDLFHENVPDEWIDQVFAVMALCPDHTFQILTKRAKRMRDYIEGLGHENLSPGLRSAWRRNAIANAAHDLFQASPAAGRSLEAGWPFPNVWIGVTAEDQTRADERRPDIAALAAQGWKTFVSYEPALGPVDWNGWEFLKHLIAGGESGPRARPSHPDWFRAARDWTAKANVPFFFKQWGEWSTDAYRISDGQAIFRQFKTFQQWVDKARTWINGGICLDRLGRNLTIGADVMRARDEGTFPITIMHRVGRRRAGYLLDGQKHREFPPT